MGYTAEEKYVHTKEKMHICSQNYEKRKYNLLLFRENKCRIQIIKINQEIHDSFYGFYV